MWKDPIVEKVRAARDAHARTFHYDADAIFADLLKKQAARTEAGVQFVSFAPRRPSGWQAAKLAGAVSPELGCHANVALYLNDSSAGLKIL